MHRPLPVTFPHFLGSIMIYSLFIINKAGTLIYLQPFGTVSPLSANEGSSSRSHAAPHASLSSAGIVLASTFHSLHAITAKVCRKGPFSEDPSQTHPLRSSVDISSLWLLRYAPARHRHLQNQLYSNLDRYAHSWTQLSVSHSRNA